MYDLILDLAYRNIMANTRRHSKSFPYTTEIKHFRDLYLLNNLQQETIYPGDERRYVWGETSPKIYDTVEEHLFAAQINNNTHYTNTFGYVTQNREVDLDAAKECFTNNAIFIEKTYNVYEPVFVIKFFPRTHECKIVRYADFTKRFKKAVSEIQNWSRKLLRRQTKKPYNEKEEQQYF